ncbi:MAG TPA: tetratricopeptide repeat protein [Chloroflexia bacterium]|nr:tetratricopeptide repeat protein [Chloroflexia bacterium]
MSDPRLPDPPAPPERWVIDSVAPARDAYVGSTVTWNVSLAALPPAFADAPFTVPYSPNPDFAGRDAELEMIAAALAGAPVAIVMGTGGQGKTQLAVEYAHRARAAGPYPGGILWVSLADPGGVAAQVALLAGPAGFNEPGAGGMTHDDRIAAVRRRWAEPVARLLVFDNCEDPALLAAWLPAGGGCRVLVTSRRHGWQRTPARRLVALAPPTREAAVAILLGPRARAQGTTPAALRAAAAAGGADAAAAICDALGDLPLALAVAGAYLGAVRSADLAGYAKRLHKAPLAAEDLAVELDEPLPTSHAPSIVLTFATSYDRLDTTAPDDRRALILLHRAAQAAPDPLPPGLLERLAGRDPVVVHAAEKTERAVNRLAALGLIEPLPDGNARLHRLLAAYVRTRTPDAGADRAAVQVALTDALGAVHDAGFPLTGTPYLPHARPLARTDTLAGDAAAGRFLDALATLLADQGDFAAARPLFERALVIMEATHGPSHHGTARILVRLARLLRNQGDPAAARPLAERALVIDERAGGPEHRAMATSLTELGAILKAQGDHAGARRCLNRAMAIHDRAKGPEDPDTARSLNHLALAEQAARHYTTARQLHEHALAIRERSLGPDHPDTAASLHHLARLLRRQGKPDAARPLAERALAIREAVLGPTHPDTGGSLDALARLWEATGHLAAARPLYARALGIRESAFGPDDRRTQDTRRRLRACDAALAAPHPPTE